jgi:hypothetical protein
VNPENLEDAEIDAAQTGTVPRLATNLRMTAFVWIIAAPVIKATAQGFGKAMASAIVRPVRIAFMEAFTISGAIRSGWRKLRNRCRQTVPLGLAYAGRCSIY